MFHFLGCALPMWWNGLALSLGFKKFIIYGIIYGTCIGYIRDYKKFMVGGGWVGGGGLFDFNVSLNQIYLNLD